MLSSNSLLHHRNIGSPSLRTGGQFWLWSGKIRFRSVGLRAPITSDWLAQPSRARHINKQSTERSTPHLHTYTYSLLSSTQAPTDFWILSHALVVLAEHLFSFQTRIWTRRSINTQTPLPKLLLLQPHSTQHNAVVSSHKHWEGAHHPRAFAQLEPQPAQYSLALTAAQRLQSYQALRVRHRDN